MAQGRLPTLREWLNTIDLPQYHDTLVNVGLDTVEQLQQFGLDDSFLTDIGISLLGHRKRILDNIPITGMAPTVENVPVAGQSKKSDHIYENVDSLGLIRLEQEMDNNSVLRRREPENDDNLVLPTRKHENDDIYVNVNISSSEESLSSPKSSESSETSEFKKKPVPKPRLSKLTKQQKEQLLQQKTSEALQSIPQSPAAPLPSPRKSKINKSMFQLSGATVEESTDFDFDPLAARRSLKRNGNPTNKYSDELMNAFNPDSNEPAVRPNAFDDNFANSFNNDRSSDNYDAIWSDSGGNLNTKESPALRKASDMSPFTPPFLPKPCSSEKFDFKNEEESNLKVNDASSYEPVVVDNGKTFYVNNRSPSIKSHPPPSFPPPSLPPGEQLPPVPPRTSNSNNMTLYSKVTKHPNAETNDEELYSEQYFKKGFFTSTKMRTLTSTSGPDPFSGEDPFQDFNFQQECQHFNQPGAENIFAPEDPTVEPAFDPFGIYEMQKNVTDSDPLEQVPPPPEWHETIQPGKSTTSQFDLYSLAGPVNQVTEQEQINKQTGELAWSLTERLPLNYLLMHCNKKKTDFTLDNSVSTDDAEYTSEGEFSEPSSPDEINHAGAMAIASVVDVVTTSPFPRKNKQKNGYLWKQGGVKANRGWRKRWVVFDGKTLRYYPNHKSQISKRVLPLACMQRVEICVKDKTGDKFKFYLHTQNRTFVFAAESLNECTLWANTLMEAIINYEKPKDGEKEGGDMHTADKMGFVKFERKGDMFVAIKNGKLCYYESHMDYKMASPINEIDLRLASIKELCKNKLQLSTHYGHFILLFTDRQDKQECVSWKMAIEDAIAEIIGDDSILDSVRENQSNHYCADCQAQDPNWASINMGIVLCKNCAGIHREFDPRVSRVKSLRMDTTIWTPSLIEMMKEIGNEKSRKFWESRMQLVNKINTDSSPLQRKQFIQDKYYRKLWIEEHGTVPELNEELLRTVVTDDILQTMKIVFSGANEVTEVPITLIRNFIKGKQNKFIPKRTFVQNVLYVQNSTGKTAFELAKEVGQRLQTEFLYHNGGDKTSRASADIDEALALRMRAEITMEGHLLKTGPKNRNVFMDRYCVIEHGCLRYFVNERSSTARDSIDNESMLCIQSVINIEKPCRHTVNFEKLLHNLAHIGSKPGVESGDKPEIFFGERSVLNLRVPGVRQLSVRRSIRPENYKRYPNAFELSTTKQDKNRTYLFAATTHEEKMTWMRTLSKLFCPIHFIKEMHDKEFSLAGNFYFKAGVACEWQKTWIMVDKKVVRYINDEQQLIDIDLRKVSNIQYVEHVAGQPCSYAVESGKCFTIDIPGRSLYFQGDLLRDTERLYEAFGNSMKGGGPTIEDQQLTTENVPVIVQKCIKFIEDNGYKEEGVYRQAAVDSRIQSLLSRFLADAHSLTLRMDTHNVNEVANCLKRFFRQLKDPLFTKTGYQDWIKCAAKDSADSKIPFYKFQLSQLPVVNRCTVRKLILHLASVAGYSVENKMDIKNIALAFGSTLMRGGAESIHQQNLPLEMRVVEDLITHHSILFEEEVQKRERTESILQEVQEKIKKAHELQHRNSSTNLSQIGEMKVTVYYQHRHNQSADFTAKRGETVAHAVDELRRKFKLSLGQWVLYEVVYSDVLERPLHPSECLLDVVMSWSTWAEEYSKNTCLILKSAERLLQLDEVYDPNHALFGEFKYKEKKDKFKKYSFGFNQSKLSLFKDLGRNDHSRNYNTQPSKSWKIEEMYIYFGADPKKNAQRLSKPPNLKYAFSFYINGEKVGKGDMPLFGRTICCTTENELINWMAAMLKAKHPDGYLAS